MRKWLLSILLGLCLTPFALAQIPDPTLPGPYEFTHVTTNLENPGYHSAIVYLPEGEGPFPATTLSGGYSQQKEDMSWLAQRLASHGILTIVFTPTNAFVTDARIWAKGHKASIETLERESQRHEGALAGKVDETNFALTGYSYGGAGTLLAARELGTKIKAVVPMNPFLPIVSPIEAAVLFITGNKDNVASYKRVLSSFEGLSPDYPRAFANINGNNHFGPTNSGNKHQEISALVIPWLKVFIAGENEFETYFRGEKIDQVVEDGLIFANPVDFVYLAP